jgi:hypothetical protein
MILLVGLALASACEPSRRPVGQPIEQLFPNQPRPAKRWFDCRELMVRLALSMCRFGDTAIPARRSAPLSFQIEHHQGITVDLCIWQWLQLAQQCAWPER